jgi:hypothetical protein
VVLPWCASSNVKVLLTRCQRIGQNHTLVYERLGRDRHFGKTTKSRGRLVLIGSPVSALHQVCDLAAGCTRSCNYLVYNLDNPSDKQHTIYYHFYIIFGGIMATTSTASSRPGRSTPPSSRRASSSLSTSPPNSISKGATARSAASAPRVSSSLNSSVVRRPSVKGPTSKSPTPSALNGESQETLSASLKEETEQKEQVLT